MMVPSTMATTTTTTTHSAMMIVVIGTCGSVEMVTVVVTLLVGAGGTDTRSDTAGHNMCDTSRTSC